MRPPCRVTLRGVSGARAVRLERGIRGDRTVDIEIGHEEVVVHLDAVLRDWNICIAQYLPAGVTLSGVEVDGDLLVADFGVDGSIATDPALQQNGTCA